MKENKNNDFQNKKEFIDINEMYNLINKLNSNVNKKEDDIKNIINEKDIIIKELKDKLNEQDNKISKINQQLQTIFLVFRKDKEIDNDIINNIKNRLYAQEDSIANYINKFIIILSKLMMK